MSRVLRFLFPYLVALAVSAAAAWTWTSQARDLHPQDGPHVDLNFELRDDAFVAHVSMNLVFLDYLIPSFREEPDRLTLSELAAASEALRRRLADVCVVTIDGQAPDAARLPTLSGLALNDPDESLVPLFPKSGMRGLRKIKFDLSWPVAAPPTSVGIVWLMYPPDELSTVTPLPPLAIAAELTAQGLRSQLEFRQAEPEFVWRALPGGASSRLLAVPTPVEVEPLRLSGLTALALVVAAWSAISALRKRRAGAPAARATVVAVASLALAPFLWRVPIATVAVGSSATGLPSSDEAAAIFRPLHENLYRAFDFTDESAIYDALAKSVDGPLLEEIYLAIHRSLVMQEEGGALSRVRAVRELDVSVEDIGMVGAPNLTPGGADESVPGFRVVCRYQVDGRVTHWGHSHDRTNEYRTRYLVVARDGRWHIAQSEVLAQARVDGVPSALPPEAPIDVAPDGAFDS
jgi:hypothetical protein